jgi:glycerol-3-phosphate acyltransferase PlsX
VKTTEGTADFIFSQLRSAITGKLQYRLAALVMRPALLAMRRRMDYGEYGGAPLLGVDGVVLVAHGRADGAAIRSALRNANEVATSGMLEGLRNAFKRERPQPEPVSSGETRA